MLTGICEKKWSKYLVNQIKIPYFALHFKRNRS